MERKIENLEAVIEQLSQRNDDLVSERLDALEKLDAAEADNARLQAENDALETDNKELRRQLVSMRAA
ncbi:hypothetical protein [Vreelandella venusta]|uniref:hypothetical protein n=1 Tax=Vreelandella venusta TaxID=44935 RepID=UPI0018DABF4F|nr:hypothetical protein [Halomonas venusta]QPI62390.1 hypothetical protein IR195_10810 [Halomonas venusta]